MGWGPRYTIISQCFCISFMLNMKMAARQKIIIWLISASMF